MPWVGHTAETMSEQQQQCVNNIHHGSIAKAAGYIPCTAAGTKEDQVFKQNCIQDKQLSMSGFFASGHSIIRLLQCAAQAT